jgi:REP element-mobilizing transposase RayT
MPRIGRAILQYYPHHVVQRGHNRQVVFAEAGDCERYLETLAQFKDVYGVKVYAFCLMTNHVHLLVAPEEIAGLGQLMKRLAGRQTRYHNRLEGRTGTLWESRYKSSPVDTDDYLLACIRYIELNPVRARMVAADSGPSRHPIPAHAGTPFRTMPAGIPDHAGRVSVEAGNLRYRSPFFNRRGLWWRNRGYPCGRFERFYDLSSKPV